MTVHTTTEAVTVTASAQRARPWRLHTLLWMWLGAVPVAFKVFGLVVLPLLVIWVGGMVIGQREVIAGIVASGATPDQVEILREALRQVMEVFTVGAAIGLVLAFLLTHVLVRPLRDLVHAMRRVQIGDLTARSPMWATDEIGIVQAEFNLMVDRLCDSRDALLSQQANTERLCQENGHLLAEVQDHSQRLQQLLRHATSAQEAERKRIARELHDETGQALTSILLRLKILQEETDIDVIHDRLNGLRYLTSQTLEEVRRLSMDLRPTALDDLGLVPAIRWYVQQAAERSGLEMTFTTSATLTRLSPEMEIILYRAVQEGLTNVMRHANARHAYVSLEQSADCVRLMVTDDGIGMTLGSQRGNGLGLAGMRERVMMAGGTVRIDAQEGIGTRILIELPWEGDRA